MSNNKKYCVSGRITDIDLEVKKIVESDNEYMAVIEFYEIMQENDLERYLLVTTVEEVE